MVVHQWWSIPWPPIDMAGKLRYSVLFHRKGHFVKTQISIWESFWFGQILLCTSSQARQLLETHSYWDLLNCICRKMAKLFIELKLKSICQKENMCISKVFMKRGFDEVEKYICNQLSKCQSFWNCCHQNIYLVVFNVFFFDLSKNIFYALTNLFVLCCCQPTVFHSLDSSISITAASGGSSGTTSYNEKSCHNVTIFWDCKCSQCLKF